MDACLVALYDGKQAIHVAKAGKIMKSNVIGQVLLVSGLLLLCISPVVLLAGFVIPIGINDGEWGHLSRTGSFSTPDALQWGAWQANDGSITAFYGYQPELEKPEFPQYRRGEAHGWLFDFVVYEGKASNVDGNRVFPAIGPGWGTQFHSIRVVSAFFLGIGMMIASRFFRSRENVVPAETSIAPA
jgi:hypothetical protein